MMIVGGSGYFLGPFAGGLVAILAPEWLRFVEKYYLMEYAILVILLMAICPTGLIGLADRWFKPRRTPVAGDRSK